MEQTEYQTLEEQGMAVYEYVVDHAEGDIENMSEVIERLRQTDISGQFFASTARYLAAVDAERFARWIPTLIEGAIERDRERRYIGSLLEAIWGADYRDRAEELSAADDNFRRIYKRLFPAPGL